MRRVFLLLGALALAVPPAARAQTAAQLLEQGITRYQNFEFESAALSIRRALSLAGPAGLPRQERARALSYLAAAELFNSRPESARAAFEQLVLLAPRYRPSSLVFPPSVLAQYDQVRLSIKAVDIVAPDTLDVRLGAGVFAPWVYASSVHEISVSVVRSDGRRVRPLYRGALSDSLPLRWDARDSTGAVVSSGSYQLRVESLGADNQVVRTAELPLDVQIVRRDTLPHPPRPDSLLKPERNPFGPALKVLATGLALGGLTAGLPIMFDAGSQAAGTRFIVGGALSLAGIAAFVSHHPGRRIPENISANAAVRAEWERARRAVVEENQRRIEDVRLRIRTGDLVQMDRAAR